MSRTHQGFLRVSRDCNLKRTQRLSRCGKHGSSIIKHPLGETRRDRKGGWWLPNTREMQENKKEDERCATPGAKCYKHFIIILWKQQGLVQALVREVSTWFFARFIFTQPVESVQLGGFQASVNWCDNKYIKKRSQRFYFFQMEHGYVTHQVLTAVLISEISFLITFSFVMQVKQVQKTAKTWLFV